MIQPLVDSVHFPSHLFSETFEVSFGFILLFCSSGNLNAELADFAI